MSIMDDAATLRTQAKQLGLVEPYFSDSADRVFVLDLNQGTLVVKPENLQKLVDLAETLSRAGMGEVNAIKELIVFTDDLDKQRVYWHRAYHYRSAVGERMTVKEWLANQVVH